MFDAGPQFVFNLGGGPGFRVHQMGGAGPRRRPRQANANSADAPPQSALSVLTNLLPLLILFVLPLLSSIFSGPSTPSGPSFRFDSPVSPHTMHRTTPKLKVDYYVNPNDVVEFSNWKMSQLDQKAEVNFVQKLQYECEVEAQGQRRMMEEAQGWFFVDEGKMNQARGMSMRSCRRLDELRVPRGY